MASSAIRVRGDASAIRGTGNEFAPENSHCRSCDYGYSTFNVPQRFVTSILYSLPFGKGQQFLNHGGIVDRMIMSTQAGGLELAVIHIHHGGDDLDFGAGDGSAFRIFDCHLQRNIDIRFQIAFRFYGDLQSRLRHRTYGQHTK